MHRGSRNWNFTELHFILTVSFLEIKQIDKSGHMRASYSLTGDSKRWILSLYKLIPKLLALLTWYLWFLMKGNRSKIALLCSQYGQGYKMNENRISTRPGGTRSQCQENQDWTRDSVLLLSWGAKAWRLWLTNNLFISWWTSRLISWFSSYEYNWCCH